MSASHLTNPLSGAIAPSPRSSTPPVRSSDPSVCKALARMQTYKDLIDTIVRCLIKEGFTFIEAYEEVLSVGRLDPRTTIHHLAHNNPSSDRESLLEFKAYNASCRLQRKYAMVLKKYAPLLGSLNNQPRWTL